MTGFHGSLKKDKLVIIGIPNTVLIQYSNTCVCAIKPSAIKACSKHFARTTIKASEEKGVLTGQLQEGEVEYIHPEYTHPCQAIGGLCGMDEIQAGDRFGDI